MKSLYFLPHYDDEVFAIPKIRDDIANGNTPVFIFFMSSTLRSLESLKLLSSLGVSRDNVILLGEKLNVPDGSLLNFLPNFYQELLKFFETKNNDIEIICPAYEGGHHDHDAISLLGRALANKWNCMLLEFFLYHGYGTRGKIYFVSSYLFSEQKINFRYSLKDWLALLKVPMIYKSQMSAMLGLWPFLILQSIFKPLVLRVSTGQSLMINMHSQVPLYERWGRTTEKQFLETAKGFQEIAPILKSLI
jgi:hypothetical protein